jgi:hypothetical protein
MAPREPPDAGPGNPGFQTHLPRVGPAHVIRGAANLVGLVEMQTCNSMNGEADGRTKRASALNRPFSYEFGSGRIR